MASLQTVNRHINAGVFKKKSTLSMKHYFLSLSLLVGTPVFADANWVSATLDNDFFVNEDNGYTNGLYVSWYDVRDSETSDHSPDFWVKPLMWSMPSGSLKSSANIYGFGQTINTADDIEIPNPPENDFPYSGLLSFNNTFIANSGDHADRVSTTLGIVGPLALGEQTQKAVHRIIDAQEPMGWDTQLKTEIVFELSRSRIWRSWASESDNMDFLSGVDMSVGTLKSSVSTGFMFRYGRNLENSYATVLLTENRMSNPTAVEEGWFVYAGVKASHTFNQIFTDGNTFRDSRSIDYNHNSNVFTSGLTYSWGESALSFAVNSPFTINGSDQDKKFAEQTRYGTLTFAWQL
ncbi:lipid A deacylase LpxR family protein [Marinomonas sp.]|uniref:lipid A deacylase LpxR family protein n=1 Tax=Marinomonas sp. TaxID=1904862 RepID=UPI003BAB9E87